MTTSRDPDQRSVPQVDATAIRREVGQRIAAGRARLGLSQAELAKRLGRSRAAISLWERGRRSPDLAELLRLGTALQCDPAIFLPSHGDHKARAVSPPEVVEALLQAEPRLSPDQARILSACFAAGFHEATTGVR
jgi:transcriptional regulator with XRE-family HTH domain